MGYYTNYSMKVLDIDNKGYNSYEIAKFMFNEKENFAFSRFPFDFFAFGVPKSRLFKMAVKRRFFFGSRL